MSKLFHITVFFPKFEQERDVSAVFDSAEDWLRYAPNNWFVVGEDSDTAKTWSDRLDTVANQDATLLVTEFNKSGNLNGRLPDKVWNWLGKYIQGLTDDE